jgi:hypothetical protein
MVPILARLEDAPFAKGPRMAEPLMIKGPAYDLIYDPYRERVYASLNGDDVGMVARLKPDTGELDGEVRLAGEVGPMAMSADGSNLWVAVHTAQAPKLCRIDLKTMKADELSPLKPTDNYDWPAPDALAMVPGTSNTFIAAYVGYKNVVVFDAAKPRLDQVGNKVCAGLVHSGDGTTFFAFNNMDTGWQLYELLVTDTGIRVVEEHIGVIDDFRIGIAAGGGRIYTGNGRVYDIKAKKTIGRLPGTGEVALDLFNRRAYQVRHESNFDQVTVFDCDSFEQRPSYVSRHTLPFRDTAKLKLTMSPQGGLTFGRRYLGNTCKRVLMLGESGLVINRGHVLTILPTVAILKVEPK